MHYDNTQTVDMLKFYRKYFQKYLKRISKTRLFMKSVAADFLPRLSKFALSVSGLAYAFRDTAQKMFSFKDFFSKSN